MKARPIRVLHLLFQYPQFAGGCYFTEYLDCLAKENFQSTLLACRYPENVAVPKTKSLDIIWIKQVGAAKVAEFFYMIQLLGRLFDNRLRGVEVINCIGPRGLIFASLHRLLFGTKVVCTIEMVTIRQGWTGRIFDRFFYLALLRLFGADLIISWSRYHSGKYLLRWGLANKLVTIPPGIKERRVTSSSRARAIRKRYAGAAETFLTFVKPLHRPNGEAAIRIIRSIEVLKDKYGIVCKLLLFKRDREQDTEVISVVEELGLDKQIEFLPFVKFSETQDYIYASDFIVLPYVYETTVSRSLLEAMQAGKLIITTSQGEVGHIIENGRNGLITTGAPDDIARILFEVKRGNIKIGNLIKGAKKTVEEQFAQGKNVHLQVERIRSMVKV